MTLCGANIPGLTQGNFDVEANTLRLNVGTAAGTSSFSNFPFNGYIFSGLDSEERIYPHMGHTINEDEIDWASKLLAIGTAGSGAA